MRACKAVGSAHPAPAPVVRARPCRSVLVPWVPLPLCLLLSVLLLAAAPAWPAGPFGGTVTALLLNAEGTAAQWAATERGLFRRDAERWSRIAVLDRTDLAGLARVGDELLAAPVRGRLLRSEDGGGTWQPSDQGLKDAYGHPVERALCLVTDPVQPQRVYVGSAGAGPFVSDDGGRSWRSLVAGLESLLPPSRHAAALLPAAGTRPLLMGSDGAGVFRWGGAAWTSVAGGLPENLRVTGLAAQPGDPNHLLLATRARGLWQSRDGGETWQQRRKGLFGMVEAVAVGADGAVLAQFAGEGLFRLAGDRVTPTRALKSARVRQLLAVAEGWRAATVHDGVLVLSPQGQVTGVDNEGLDATRIHSVLRTADGVWCGDDNGAFFSAAGDGEWQERSQGLPGAPVSALLRHSSDLLAGTLGQGVFRWDGEASAWQDLSQGMGTANTVFSLVQDADGQRLYAGTEGGVLVRSGGESGWVRSNQGLPGTATWRVAADCRQPGRLWAAGGGAVFRSDDGAVTWQRLGDTAAVALAVGCETQDSSLWVLEVDRLLRQEDGALVPAGLRAGSDEVLTALLPQAGGVWVAGSRGLWRVDAEGSRRLWEGAGLLSLHRAGEYLYAGTDGRGVVRFRLQ